MSAIANLLAFCALVVTLLLVWRQSWPGRLRLFVAQSVLLALLAAVAALLGEKPVLLVVAGIIVVLKVWIIPRVLWRVARGTPVRPVGPGRSAGVALLTSGVLVVIAFLVMLPAARLGALPTSGAIPLAFAMVLIGLFVCVTGRDVLAQIVGFLVFENAVFATALLSTYGLPGLVEAGVFLDVLVIVLILEGIVVEIRREHESIDVERLRELRH